MNWRIGKVQPAKKVCGNTYLMLCDMLYCIQVSEGWHKQEKYHERPSGVQVSL